MTADVMKQGGRLLVGVSRLLGRVRHMAKEKRGTGLFMGEGEGGELGGISEEMARIPEQVSRWIERGAETRVREEVVRGVKSVLGVELGVLEGEYRRLVEKREREGREREGKKARMDSGFGERGRDW